MKYFFYILILSFSAFCFGQKSYVNVSNKVVKVGVPFEIEIKVEIPRGKTIQIEEKLDTLSFRFKNEKGIFESISEKFEITSFSQEKQSDVLWKGIIKALIWDSGTFVFPAISYKIDNQIFNTDSVLIEGRLEDKIAGQDIYEIRESFIDVKEAEKKAEAEKKESNKFYYLLTIVTAVFILIIIFLMLRRVRKKREEKLSRELSLSERAILAIDELEKLELWKKERHKEHFVELSFILRSYFSSLYQLNLLEKTTSETIILLNQKKMSKQLVIQIEFVLKHADMVKFAKSVLEENYILSLDNQARDSIKHSVKDK